MESKGKQERDKVKGSGFSRAGVFSQAWAHSVGRQFSSLSQPRRGKRPRAWFSRAWFSRAWLGGVWLAPAIWASQAREKPWDAAGTAGWGTAGARWPPALLRVRAGAVWVAAALLSLGINSSVFKYKSKRILDPSPLLVCSRHRSDGRNEIMGRKSVGRAVSRTSMAKGKLTAGCHIVTTKAGGGYSYCGLCNLCQF